MEYFDPDDEAGTREAVRRLFATPADVVDRHRGPGLSVEALRAQDDAAGTWRMVHVPGRVLTDLDGTPTAVEPGEDVATCIGGPVITEADVQRLGIDPADFPNTTVTPTPTRRTTS